MIRVEIELSVPGQSVFDVAETISHALSKEERMGDTVIHRLTVEEADAE